jgi:iron complex transport system permease protein
MSNYFSVRNKSGSFSLQMEKRSIIIFFAFLCLLFLVLIIGLAIGSTMINPFTVFLHLIGFQSPENQFIINTLRLPRMLLSLLVGIALGVAGLILQGLVRNPLASPDIIGVSGGASAAAVLFITYFSGTISIKFLPIAAILGAAIVTLVIYLLAWKKGVTSIRLVLIGIGVAAAMSALTTTMIVLNPTYTTGQAYIWLTGTVYGANWGHVQAMLPWIVIFVPFALFLSREVNVQELGDSVALGLGSRVQFYRFVLLMISVALTGSAVAYGGGIGFVGLIAPHIARKIVGRSFGVLVPVTAIIGGLIVILADVVARTAFLPLDLPAGVLVSGIGAPFFIYLLYKNRNL